MSLLQNSNAISAPADTGFYEHQIANSIRVSNSSANSTATNYLYRDGGAGNRDTWTIGMWIKRARIATSSSHTAMAAWGGHSGSGSARGYGMVNDYYGTINGMSFENNNGSSWHLTTRTSAMYRDLSAWTHVCWRYDSTQSTEADRARMYVNGELITNLQSTTYPAQNADHSWNGGGYQFIGTNGTGTNGNNPHQGFDGYIAEVVAIDGTSLDPMDNLVETKNGVIIPKDPSGLTFGSEGFWLKFTNSSALGEDFSGNDNDFTVAGIATHDQMLDSPTNNFCTLNPLSNVNSGTLSEGNLKATASAWTAVYGTFEVPVTGSWYWEYISENHVYAYPGVQTVTTESNQQNHDFVAVQTGEYRYEGTGEANTSSISTGDIIGFWVNDGVIKVYVNNSLDHTFSTNMTNSVNAGKTFFPSHIGSSAGKFNFGADSSFQGAKTAQGNGEDGEDFYYSPPSGARALSSASLSISDSINPAETDDNYPQKLFSATIWTGNGSGRTISSGSKSDAVWIKRRNGAAAWAVQDTTRGTSSALEFNTNAQEDTNFTQGVTAFGSSSFNIGTHSQVNSSSNTYVGYAIAANGGTTSTNSTGSVNVTQQVDPSGHFSISTYSGAGGTGTIGHGLSSAPTFVVIKQRNNSNSWTVFAKGAQSSGADFAYLEGTGAWQDGSSSPMWQNTQPSNTLVYLGDNSEVNHSGKTYVAYCWADCEGYIKSGGYEGNGSTDGTFVYTGFRPSFVMNRRTDGSGSWLIHDDARNAYNPTDKILLWNDSGAEFSGANDKIDMLANGFKLRSSNAGINGSGNDYIYLAFAKQPLKYAVAR